jgi:putative membrane protein
MNMNSFIIYRIFANIIAFWFAGALIPGFETGDVLSLLSASLVLTFLHFFIRPVMVFFTLPFQILSMGILYLLFNSLYVKLTSLIVSDIIVKGFFPAVGAAAVISLVNMVLDGFAQRQRQRDDEPEDY